jgi:hypothetical protein
VQFLLLSLPLSSPKRQSIFLGSIPTSFNLFSMERTIGISIIFPLWAITASLLELNAFKISLASSMSFASGKKDLVMDSI